MNWNRAACKNINVSTADPKKIASVPLPKQERSKALQEKKEIKQWKESDDETLTLPNWKYVVHIC